MNAILVCAHISAGDLIDQQDVAAVCRTPEFNLDVIKLYPLFCQNRLYVRTAERNCHKSIYCF